MPNSGISLSISIAISDSQRNFGHCPIKVITFFPYDRELKKKLHDFISTQEVFAYSRFSRCIPNVRFIGIQNRLVDKTKFHVFWLRTSEICFPDFNTHAPITRELTAHLAVRKFTFCWMHRLLSSIFNGRQKFSQWRHLTPFYLKRCFKIFK